MRPMDRGRLQKCESRGEASAFYEVCSWPSRRLAVTGTDGMWNGWDGTRIAGAPETPPTLTGRRS